METKPPYPFCPRCGFSLLHGWEDRAPIGCLYCEETKKLTDEHIRKLARPDLQTAPGLKVKQRHMRPEFRSMGPTPVHMRSNRIKQDPYDLQSRAVCEDCNRGWMHDNVDAAKPLVRALAEGG
jgi:hypothetical protein